MITQKQRSAVLYAIAAVLLTVPFIAMKFTKEVNWSGFDFLVAGILIFGAAFSVDLVLRNFKTFGKRLIYVGIVLAIIFLVWAELAVGIFGTPFAGN